MTQLFLEGFLGHYPEINQFGCVECFLRESGKKRYSGESKTKTRNEAPGIQYPFKCKWDVWFI